MARASSSKVYLYFMKKGRQARHRIPGNYCLILWDWRHHHVRHVLLKKLLCLFSPNNIIFRKEIHPISKGHLIQRSKQEFMEVNTLHSRSMFAIKAKIYGELYKQSSSALTLLMKYLVIGQRLNTPNFSAFHGSPRGSLVSIGQHFVATRVVHLPKSTETTLITEAKRT